MFVYHGVWYGSRIWKLTPLENFPRLYAGKNEYFRFWLEISLIPFKQDYLSCNASISNRCGEMKRSEMNLRCVHGNTANDQVKKGFDIINSFLLALRSMLASIFNGPLWKICCVSKHARVLFLHVDDGKIIRDFLSLAEKVSF